MSANVETMMYVREKPWHGLGTRVEEAPTSADALRLAGLDWTVDRKPLQVCGGPKVENFFANVRSSDGSVLGVVSDRYKVVQNTDAIIMCCKGHCQLEGACETPMEAIATYMSNECACPKEDYKGALMESILREALFDYIAGADKPGYELRQLFHQFAFHEPSLSERICTMFRLTRVRNDDGSYANGFSDVLLEQSEKDLGGKVVVG